MAVDLEGLLVYTERVGKEAAEKTAKSIVRETKKLLVPGHGYDTGKLKRGYRAIRTALGWAVVQTDPDRGPVPSGTGSIWSFVEFGTKKMRARPHIRPAMEIVKARMARRSR